VRSLRCPTTGQISGSHPPPVEKTPPSHREPSPTTSFGLLSPRWKAPRTVRSHPPEHVDEICLWCDTPLMSCGTANMPHGHNGRDVTARAKIAKSENAVPPWSVCPFAATLARDQSTLNSLEKVYTGPGYESLYRPLPWLVGRDRELWLELSARFSNRRPGSINSPFSADLTHFQSTDVIHFQFINFSDGCIQSDLTSLLRYFRFSGCLWGSGVRSAYVRSRTSAVKNRQVRGICGIFGSLPQTL